MNDCSRPLWQHNQGKKIFGLEHNWHMLNACLTKYASERLLKFTNEVDLPLFRHILSCWNCLTENKAVLLHTTNLLNSRGMKITGNRESASAKGKMLATIFSLKEITLDPGCTKSDSFCSNCRLSNLINKLVMHQPTK